MHIRFQEKFNGLPAILKSVLFWLVCFAFMGLSLLISQFVPKEWFWYSWGIIGTLNVLLVSKIFLNSEHQKLRDIGLFFNSGTIIRFMTGIIIGGVMMGSVIILLIHFGGLHLTKAEHANPTIIFLWSLALVPAALLEEIAFRAYTLNRLQVAHRLLMSQIIIAIAFAIYHMIGGMNWIDALIGTGI
jgi:membrane protease YdiL (CAAX protease family)